MFCSCFCSNYATFPKATILCLWSHCLLLLVSLPSSQNTPLLHELFCDLVSVAVLAKWYTLSLDHHMTWLTSHPVLTLCDLAWHCLCTSDPPQALLPPLSHKPTTTMADLITPVSWFIFYKLHIVLQKNPTTPLDLVAKTNKPPILLSAVPKTRLSGIYFPWPFFIHGATFQVKCECIIPQMYLLTTEYVSTSPRDLPVVP